MIRQCFLFSDVLRVLRYDVIPVHSSMSLIHAHLYLPRFPFPWNISSVTGRGKPPALHLWILSDSMLWLIIIEFVWLIKCF